MMIFSGRKVSKVLESLIPSDDEELNVLQHLIYCAQIFQRSEKNDLALSQGERMAVRSPQPMGFDTDVRGFLASLSDSSKKYFYSLVEALDIYESIKGRELQASIQLEERALHELKQIQDMCLQEGPHAVY